MQDRYGNELGTTSERAHKNYCDGIDLLLSAQPGGIEKLKQAIGEDADFAVAHANLARALQIDNQPADARQFMEHARTLVGGLSAREQAHVHIIGLLVDGQSAAAYQAIQQHVLEFPRDVMVVQPCCGVFGLIGFSGRVGREAENVAFMTSLAQHYVDDWWFESQFAFALCEVGQLARAEILIEKALAANPTNANAVHHRAHIRYESGEVQAGHAELKNWRQSYDRAAILHCHLAWHDALWTLEGGSHDFDRVLEIIRADIHPDVAAAPPINVMTDLVAILLRSEIAGHPRQTELWQIASDYAAQQFGKPGISFADVHAAVAFAVTHDTERLTQLQQNSRGVAADIVAKVAGAFVAFISNDWSVTVDNLAPIMSIHERLGGSRAQRDFLERTFSYSLTRLGLQTEATRHWQMRRPLIASP